MYAYGEYPRAAMKYLEKKGIAPVFYEDDAEILKAAAKEISFMGVNYYQSCVCEYNPLDGVTPYGTMNTTGIKGSGQITGIPGVYKNPQNKFLKTGATPLQQSGSNSIKLAKTNLPAEKLQVESFKFSASPHNHGIPNVEKSGLSGRRGAISGGNTYGIDTTTITSTNLTSSSVSPYTTAMGSGTPLTINPEHITVKAWKRLS